MKSPKQLPKFRPEDQVVIRYRGKTVRGFIAGPLPRNEPIDRYVVIVLPRTATSIDDFWRNGGSLNQVRYVYKDRAELESQIPQGAVQ